MASVDHRLRSTATPIATVAAVPPPPAARDKVLDAFERLLIEHGERETTLDAVARAAGVSKGGLIYHFGSREALIEGLLGRLEVLADEDLAADERRAGRAGSSTTSGPAPRPMSRWTGR